MALRQAIKECQQELQQVSFDEFRFLCFVFFSVCTGCVSVLWIPVAVVVSCFSCLSPRPCPLTFFLVTLVIHFVVFAFLRVRVLAPGLVPILAPAPVLSLVCVPDAVVFFFLFLFFFSSIFTLLLLLLLFLSCFCFCFFSRSLCGSCSFSLAFSVALILFDLANAVALSCVWNFVLLLLYLCLYRPLCFVYYLVFAFTLLSAVEFLPVAPWCRPNWRCLAASCPPSGTRIKQRPSNLS